AGGGRLAGPLELAVFAPDRLCLADRETLPGTTARGALRDLAVRPRRREPLAALQRRLPPIASSAEPARPGLRGRHAAGRNGGIAGRRAGCRHGQTRRRAPACSLARTCAGRALDRGGSGRARARGLGTAAPGAGAAAGAPVLAVRA